MDTYRIRVNVTPEFPQIEFEYQETNTPDHIAGYVTGVFSLIGNSDEITENVLGNPKQIQFNKELIIYKKNHEVNAAGILYQNETILEDSDEVRDVAPEDYSRRYGARWKWNYIVYLEGPKNNMIVQYEHPDFMAGLREAYTDFGLRPRDHIRNSIAKSQSRGRARASRTAVDTPTEDS